MQFIYRPLSYGYYRYYGNEGYNWKEYILACLDQVNRLTYWLPLTGYYAGSKGEPRGPVVIPKEVINNQ
jgi:hypothetical protein